MVIKVDCQEYVSAEQEPDCTIMNVLSETAATLERDNMR